MDKTSCQHLSNNEEAESISQLCSGFNKYQLKLDADDLRETLSVITPDTTNYPLELWHNISRDFSRVGEKIAWKTDGKSNAKKLIFDFFTENEELGNASYTVVVKLEPQSVCITEVITPAIKNYLTLNSTSNKCLFNHQKWENSFATIISMQAGDIACYIKLRNHKNRTYTEYANFDLCEHQTALIAEKVFIEYINASLLAPSCEGNLDCNQSINAAIIENIYPIEMSYPIFSCHADQHKVELKIINNSFELKWFLENKPYNSPQKISKKLPELYGNSVAFSGGGGAWLNFIDQNQSYAIYSGIGKWGDNESLNTKEGLLIKKNKQIIQHLRCNKTSINEIGPQLMQQFSIRANDYQHDFSN